MQSTNQELQNLLSKLKELNNAMDTTKMVETLDKLLKLTDSLNKIIDNNIKSLEKINSLTPNDKIVNLINNLNNAKDLVNKEKDQLVDLKTALSNNVSKKI